LAEVSRGVWRSKPGEGSSQSTPTQFLRLVQASIPAAPASKSGRGIAGIGQTAAAMRA